MNAQRFAHVPLATVRFWAWLDTSVTWMLALPMLSTTFVAGLYAMNGWIGSAAEAPAFAPIHILFASLTGSLVSIWCLARILYPAGWMAAVDGWGRLWIGTTLVWIILAMSGPPVLWLFVFTEWIGAFVQLRAAYSRKGSISIASP